MKRLTPFELQEIENRWKDASPGPWEALDTPLEELDADDLRDIIVQTADTTREIMVVRQWSDCEALTKAPEDVAALLVDARQAREDVKWLVEQLRRMLCENPACRPCVEDRARLAEMDP